jgi:hypothetical protein
MKNRLMCLVYVFSHMLEPESLYVFSDYSFVYDLRAEWYTDNISS